jgi:uncharacterized RDD family membrane protein YckC
MDPGQLATAPDRVCAIIAARAKITSNPVPAESTFPTDKTHYGLLPAAPLWRRLAALFYDSLLLLALALAYAAAVYALEVQLLGAREARVLHWQGTEGVLAALFYLGLWAWLSLYCLWCWRRSGQTLGMKIWRLRLQQPDGNPPTWAQAWLRCALAPLALVSVVGYLWCLWSRTGDALHDLASNTRLVVLPKAG